MDTVDEQSLLQLEILQPLHCQSGV